MREFRDEWGRCWQASLDGEMAGRVGKLLGIDLREMTLEKLGRLTRHVCQTPGVVEELFRLLLGPQCKSRGLDITGREFRETLAGSALAGNPLKADRLDRATEAILGCFVDLMGEGPEKQQLLAGAHRAGRSGAPLLPMFAAGAEGVVVE